MTIDNCNIICDLLPSYIDGICSEDSRIAVEKHLKKCEHCGNTYNEMTGVKIEPMVVDEVEIKNITEPFVKINTRYHIKVLSCVVAILILMGLITATFRPGIINNDLKNNAEYAEKLYDRYFDKFEEITLMTYKYYYKKVVAVNLNHDIKSFYWDGNGYPTVYLIVDYDIIYEDGTSEERQGSLIGVHYLWGYVKWHEVMFEENSYDENN